MPISDMAKIQNVPGVIEVAQRAYFLGSFGEPQPKNMVAALATDPELFFRIRPGFRVTNESLRAIRQDRAGMLATSALLRYFGWKLGDAVALRSQLLKSDGSADWAFNIVGTFDAIGDPNATLGIINYSYLDDSRAENHGTAEMFYERIADATKAVATAAAIDRIFANSSHETRTHSDQERAQFQAKQMGDVRFLTNAIMGAVLFTLAFLTGNTLRQSIHERIPEFAVLKALGYTHGRVLSLGFAEAQLLYIPSAVLGLLLAYMAAPLAKEIGAAIVVSPAVALAGLACAILLAFLGAAPEFLRAIELAIASAGQIGTFDELSEAFIGTAINKKLSLRW
jgi:putative ABC transport system permease protein